MSRPSQLASYANNSFANALPYERGAVAVHNKYDFFRNMWGVPEDLSRAMEANQNMQPMDIVGFYKDRVIDVPSRQLTAMILNGQASWLTDIAAPIFPTAEFNFQSSTREMNMIEYTRTAPGGIPNEQTYRTTTWKDTIEKVQLNARLEMDLSLDPNFGEAEWEFQLAGLAANAMLTIYKTIAYSIIHIAYTNLVGENVKTNPYSHARLLSVMNEYFAVVPFDSVKYMRMIRRFENSIPDFDTVVIPHNSVAYIAELLGESVSMQSQKVVTDPVTGELQWRFGVGKRSVGTVQYGDRLIHFVEMPQFHVNMVQDPGMEQALRTSVTVAEVYVPDVDCHADDNIGLLQEANIDLAVFEQTKLQGDEVKISTKDAYSASFYYDPAGLDGLSRYAHAFVEFKNNQLTDKNNIPWRYNPANPDFDRAGDINTESPYGYNVPDMKNIAQKEKVEDMRGWRDQFFGLTYLPQLNLYRLPQRMADFELAALPNKWLHKSARALNHAANAMSSSGLDFDQMMDETDSLLDDIANTPYDDTYLAALINTNISKMFDYSKTAPVFTPDYKKDKDGKKVSDLPEWKPNQFGALDLPNKNGRITQAYPPGFDSGPGLQTLAREADKDTSDWREPGQRAKRVVAFWETFVRLIKAFIGDSDIVDESLTPAWFHVNSSIAVLIDSLRHYRAPVFLAVPAELNYPLSGVVDNKNRAVASVQGSVTAADDISNARMVTNLTKFIVILRAYSGGDTISAATIDGIREGLSEGGQAHRLIVRAIHRLIDFTVIQAYTPKTASIDTLNVILFYARKLAAFVTSGPTDADVEVAAKQIEAFINNNKNKTAITAAQELYERISKDSHFCQKRGHFGGNTGRYKCNETERRGIENP